MIDVTVYFTVGHDNEYWSGIPRERALEWTRVFLRRRPSVPGTIIWRVAPNLEQGIPAGFTDWARRAEVAEAIGFTPETYEALHAALDGIDPTAFPAHPDNHLITTGLVPVRPFDADRWSSWNARVDAGTSAHAVTRELLGASVRASLAVPEDELGRTIDLADWSFLSPVILHAPHAGTRVRNSALEAFTVSRDELEEQQRLLTDHATDRMIGLAGVTSRIAAGLSRLAVDVERVEGEQEEMEAVGMGGLCTHGTDQQPIRALSSSDRTSLLGYLHTSGSLFADLVDRVLERQGRAVILDVHSFQKDPLPSELHADDRRPELCIGVDPGHTPPALMEAVRAAFDGWDIAVNETFRGSYVPLRHLGDPQVSSVTLEIRRDRYIDADGEVQHDAVLDIARRIRAVVAAV